MSKAKVNEIMTTAKAAAHSNGYEVAENPMVVKLAARVAELESAPRAGMLGVVDMVEIAIRQFCGAQKPADLAKHAMTQKCGAGVQDGPVQPKPRKYDSKSKGIIPDIRGQKQCGFCWGFGATRGLEVSYCSQLGIQGHTVDFSEQAIADCVPCGGCNGDWHSTAFEFFKSEGTVDEADDPYRADSGNGQCHSGKYFADDWSYVGANPDGVATVDEIKTAIMDKRYGGVVAAMYVTGQFMSYSSGVFRDSTNYGGNVNHMIFIRGWDDDLGCWICDNHWETTWGEVGSFRIAYGALNVGYAAAVPLAKVPTPPTPPVPPTPDPIPPGPTPVNPTSYTLTGTFTGTFTGTMTPSVAPADKSPCGCDGTTNAPASWFTGIGGWAKYIVDRANDLVALYGPAANDILVAAKSFADAPGFDTAAILYGKIKAFEQMVNPPVVAAMPPVSINWGNLLSLAEAIARIIAMFK